MTSQDPASPGVPDDDEEPSIGPGRIFQPKSDTAPSFTPGALEPATPAPPAVPGALMGDGDTQTSGAPLSLYGNQTERTPAAAIVAIVLGLLVLGGLAFLFRGVFLG